MVNKSQKYSHKNKKKFLITTSLCRNSFPYRCSLVRTVSFIALFLGIWIGSYLSDSINDSLVSLTLLVTVRDVVETSNKEEKILPSSLSQSTTVAETNLARDVSGKPQSIKSVKRDVVVKSIRDSSLLRNDTITKVQGNQYKSETSTNQVQEPIKVGFNHVSKSDQNILASSYVEVKSETNGNSGRNPCKFHIVFSTGCNSFQDWQSYAFFFHVWKSGQTGNVTRLVSGCDESTQRQMENIFEKQILSSIPTARERFSMHFTPDYQRIHFDMGYEENPQPYPFFNKPWSLRHWMENKLGFSRDENNVVTIPKEMKNTIIIVLDPDQIIMKPFKDDYTDDTTIMWHGYEQPWFLPKHFGYKIRKGLPFSQVYAFWNYWVQDVVRNITEVIRSVNWPDKLFDHGLTSWNGDDVNNFYIAGPPYIADATDMYDIVKVWSNVVVPVYYFSKKDHLSEMFAYSTAASFLKLPHVLAYSFMVSHPEAGHLEGWYDQSYNTPNIHNDTYFMQWSNPSYQNTEHQDAIPNVMHFCQEYMLGPYYFFKYYLPTDILTCSHPMLLEPPSLLKRDPTNNTMVISTNEKRSDCGKIAFRYNSGRSPGSPNTEKKHNNKIVIKAHGFSLCQMIYRLNDAIEFWKINNCPQENGMVNYDKIFVFHQNQELAFTKDDAR